MASTPRGIPLADETTIVNPIQTPLNAMAEALDAAIGVAIASVPQNYRIGSNADRLTPVGWVPFEGLRYYTTDTDIDWFYTGSIWVPEDRIWTTLSPAVGWTPASSGALKYRRHGGMLEILPVELVRTGNVTIAVGNNIVVGVLPTGFRPTSTRALGTGSIGVAGNLGASRWFVESNGNIIFQSLVSTGTMSATDAGIQNHVQFGGGMFELN